MYIQNPTMTILVIDGQLVPNPEDLAMLQALYSRSALSVQDHLAKLSKMGSGRFMDNYVVGYNHKSIADCGSTTLFIEGVSLLAAKAIQDWPLYCGQETSTRILDFSRQPIIDPLGTEASKAVLRQWMDFYLSSQDRVIAHVRSQYPMGPDDKPESYERAVKARSFDILRGFLPAGVTTQLSWHTNLRQASDHLLRLVYHPSPEIRQIALNIKDLLHQKYGSSGFGESLAGVSGVVETSSARLAREAWEAEVAGSFTYGSQEDWFEKTDANPLGKDFPLLTSTISKERLQFYGDILAKRPKGCVLPHFLSDLGQIQNNFLLDFGSFRDIQRHRNGVCVMPLLTTDYGFEMWYLDQLPSYLLSDVQKLLLQQSKTIRELTDDPVLRQYYIALGYRVPCSITLGLPAMVYVLEQRSGKTIHPTLRKIVLSLAQNFRTELPMVPIHVDEDPDDWSVRRGDQTITEKVRVS